MATRALDGNARLSEANNAASEVAAAKKRLSDLKDAEELVKTTRSKFKAQLDETLRDSVAFLGWFDQLDEPRKHEMLRLLESKRAAFAREFSAALASGAAQATKPQNLLGKVKAKTAEYVGSSNPEKRVFVKTVGDGSLRLAAHDGEWYLTTGRGYEAAFREARDACGLPESATREEVREAARKHLDSAKKREADALSQLTVLGKTPELHELPSALRRLSLADQEWVVKQLPGVAKYVKHVAQAGIDLVEGPQRKGSGIDF
jgi:hypothetical protein